MVKDRPEFFADERAWAMHRKRWRIAQWWRNKRLVILSALIIAIYLLATYYDEREKRRVAEVRAYQMAYSTLHAGCYTTERPTSPILAAGSEESLYLALHEAGKMADEVRMGMLIARGKK